MKAKPEITGWSPGDRGKVSPEKMIREAEAMVEAGAWKIMIEEDGLFSSGNTANDERARNRAAAWRSAPRIPAEMLVWRARSVVNNRWRLNSFGYARTNLCGDESMRDNK